MTDARLIVEAMHGDLERFDNKLRARSTAIMRESLAELGGQLGRARLGAWGVASNLAAMTLTAGAVQRLAARQAGALAETLPAVARASWSRQADLLQALDAKFNGAVRPLRFDGLAWLEEHSAKQIRLRQFPRSYARYGEAAVRQIEDELAKLALTGAPWTEARPRVWSAIRGVVGDRQWMVDRILVTENSAIYNGIAHEAMLAEDTPADPMLKRLVAIWDKRTGSDSKAVHGQVRRVRDMFEDPLGRRYPYPPNRPRDREIVVPQRGSWGERIDYFGGPRGEAAEVTSTPEPLPIPPAPAKPAAPRPQPDRSVAISAAAVLLLAGQVAEAKRRPAEGPAAAPPPALLADLERARIELAAARLAADARAGRGVRVDSLRVGEALSGGGLDVHVVGARPVAEGVRIVLAIGDSRIVFIADAAMVVPLRRQAGTLRPAPGLRSLAVAAVVAALRTLVRPAPVAGDFMSEKTEAS